MLKLGDAEMRSLLAQPETGMGYQDVEVTRWDYRTERGVVYNAELLFSGNEKQDDLRTYPYTSLLRLAKSSGGETSVDT